MMGEDTDKDYLKKAKAAYKQMKINNIENELAGIKGESSPFINDKGKFVPSTLACWLHEESDFHFLRIRQTNELYFYKEGIYVPFGAVYLEQIIQNIIGWEAVITKSAVNEIIGYMSRLCVADIDIMSTRENIVVCNNGVVDLLTKKLSPHSHKNYAFKKIPWNYKPTAKCPNVDALIDKLIPEAGGHQVSMMTGYTLINSYIYNQIFFLHGPPGTGKTTITNVISHLLNPDNVSNVRLHDLIDRPFMRVALINSFANFSGDASNVKIPDASILKVLSGDGRMDIDMKNVAIPIKLQNSAKIIVDTNEMPTFDNREDGIHRRIIVMQFNYVVPESEKSAHFLDTLTTQEEMEGLFVKAVDAAHDILTTDNPFNRMPVAQSKAEYEAMVWNVVDDFIASHIQIIPQQPDEEECVYETQPDIWLQFKAFMESRSIQPRDYIKTRPFNQMLRKKCGIGMPVGKTVNKVKKNVYKCVKLINITTELHGFKYSGKKTDSGRGANT